MSECFDKYLEEVNNAIIDEMEEWEIDEDRCHDEKELQECFDKFMDEMRDFITGNANGSYTMSSYWAKENLKDVIFDEQLWFSLEANDLTDCFIRCLRKNDFEGCDVIVRDLVISDNWGVFCDMFVDHFHAED